MVSKSIRSSGIPDKIIVMWRGTSLPTNFTHLSSTDCKFIKVVNSVDPNTTSGSSTHTHTSASHSHTSDSIPSHVHDNASTTGSLCKANTSSYDCNSTINAHTHTLVHGSNSGDAITLGSDTAHSHDTGSNEPSYKTIRFIKYSNPTSVSMRVKNLPKDALTVWSKTTSVPNGHIVFSDNDGYHIKGNTVADSIGGSNTHQHASDSGSTHAFSGGSHTHSLTIQSFTKFNTSYKRLPYTGSTQGSSDSNSTHTHNLNSASSTGSGSVSGNTTTDGSHQHNSLSNEPPYINISLLRSSINIRSTGIQKSVSVIWEDVLSSIPTGLQLADGTNGTTDLRTKYLKPSNSSIGSTGGSSSHEHDSIGNHDHGSFSVSHSHYTGYNIYTSSYTSSSHIYYNNSGSNVEKKTHDHRVNFTSSTHNTSATASLNGAHTHGSQTHTPPTLELAVLEKL